MIKIITEHFPHHCSGVVIIYIPSPHYPILERAINRGIFVPHSFHFIQTVSPAGIAEITVE